MADEANPFGQVPGLGGKFSAQPSVPQSGAEQDNPFGRVPGLGGDMKKAAAPKSRGVAIQFPVGFNETLLDMLGAPVDVTTGALNWGLRRGTRIMRAARGEDESAPAPQIEKPFAGSESLKRAAGVVGLNPEDIPATTTGERLARGTGGGVGALVAPEIVGAKLPGAVRSAGGLIKQMFAGATGGLTGEGAAEVSPEPFKPAARVAGGLAGGVAGAIAAEGPQAVAQAAAGARRAAEPFSAAGQERAAARTLGEAATNPEQAAQTLETAPRELVPGSQPTTAQLSGDMGLLGLERDVATRNPVEFQARRAEQNVARTGALQNLTPQAAPAEVSNYLRNELARIDQETQIAHDQAQVAAQTAGARIGGEVAPEVSGMALRGPAAAAERAARAQERRLWNAVDPDGSVTVPMGPIKQLVSRVYGNLSQAATATLNATEKAILGVVEGYGDTAPFRELTDLRSVVSAGMRAEARGERGPAYARLTQLRQGIEMAMTDMVEGRVAQEQQAVAAGQMAPEATIASQLQAEVNAFKASRAQASARIAETGGGAAPAGGRAGAPGVAEAAPPGGRPGPSPSTLGGGGSPQAPAPGLDEATRERLAAATQATRERKTTFGENPLKGILQSTGVQGQYRLPNGAVPDSIFRPGPRGFETVQSYLQAVGNDPAAIDALREHVASTLRRQAMRPDGTLDPARFAAWQRRYADAIRAVPDGMQRYADAARATEAIGDAAVARRTALDAAQDGAIGRLIGATDSQDTTRIIGGIFGQKDAHRQMGELAQRAHANPDAWNGFRRAVVDYMYNKFVSNAEAGTSGVGQIKSDSFQNFLRQNQATLNWVFSPREQNTLRAIAADLNRANRSIIAIKLPGGSNTPQDLVKTIEKGGSHGSLLTQMIVGGLAGYEAGGTKGALLGFTGVLGKQGISRMREAGMTKIDDLVKRAMLDPDLGASLLRKAPPKGNSEASVSFLARLARLSMFAVPH